LRGIVVKERVFSATKPGMHCRDRCAPVTIRGLWNARTGGVEMGSLAVGDFLIGVGIFFVIEGLLFAASPNWMREAMKSAILSPDHILRAVGFGSAIVGLVLIWLVRFH
jgi:uncharacterized protein YjeT (DUF2065 family)